MNHICERGVAIYNDTPNKITQQVVEMLKNNRESIEMELQCSNILLDLDDSTAVEKLPSDFFE